MVRLLTLLFLCSLAAVPLGGQTAVAPLQNSSVTGRYFFRHLQFSTDTSGNVTNTVGSLGTLLFNGAGRFTIDGLQTIGSFAAVSLTGTGIYSIQSSGVMTLSNPQRSGYTINARFGAEAILGSTTASGDNTFDLFAAIPAPSASSAALPFQGNYATASFELQGGTASGARSALFTLPILTGGGIGSFPATGHVATLQSGAVITQTVVGASFALNGDGTGTISLGGTSALVNGTRNLYVSQSGNVFLAGSPYAGGQDFLIGVRQSSGKPAVSDFTGLYWTGGLRLDTRHLSTEATVGSLNALPSIAQAVSSDRLHQLGITAEEAALANPYAINADGTFGLNLNVLSLGTGGSSFVSAGLSAVDPGGYSLYVGIRAPTFASTGVFLNPLGVLNAASFAPAGAAIAPGEFVSLFGSGLASDAASSSAPYPLVLGGVAVQVNGLAAPVVFVSPTQVNFLVPYAVTGAAASVVLTNGGSVSNTVTLPLQATAPGAFSADGSGTGFGAIAHANGNPVTAADPARRGETVVVYAAGLGAVSPAATDGIPASGTTANPVAVTIAGQAASVAFAGLSPLFPGLYQINVAIPNTLVGTGALPLAIQTVDAYHDQVDLQVQ